MPCQNKNIHQLHERGGTRVAPATIKNKKMADKSLQTQCQWQTTDVTKRMWNVECMKETEAPSSSKKGGNYLFLACSPFPQPDVQYCHSVDQPVNLKPCPDTVTSFPSLLSFLNQCDVSVFFKVEYKTILYSTVAKLLKRHKDECTSD